MNMDDKDDQLVSQRIQEISAKYPDEVEKKSETYSYYVSYDVQSHRSSLQWASRLQSVTEMLRPHGVERIHLEPWANVCIVTLVDGRRKIITATQLYDLARAEAPIICWEAFPNAT